MPKIQFSPKQLARLITNVDRDTLKEAIEIADMWDLFTSYERGVLVELGGAFNSLANLNVFGAEIITESYTRLFRELRDAVKRHEENPLARMLLQVLFWLMHIVFDVKQLEAAEEALGPGRTEEDWDALMMQLENYEIIMTILQTYSDQAHGWVSSLAQINWHNLCDTATTANLDNIGFAVGRLHRNIDLIWGRVRQVGEGELPTPWEDSVESLIK